MTSPSFAQEGSFALEYSANLYCPDQVAFSELAREKLAAAGVESTLPSGQRVTVILRAAESGFTGQLELHRADGSVYDREVSGAKCDEVANALAFVLALALGAKEANAVATPAAPEVAEPLAAQPEAAAPPPVPQPAAPVLPATTAAATPRLPEPPGEARRSAWSAGGGVRVGVRAGLSPEAMLVEGAFLEARRASTTALKLTFRLGVSNAQRSGQASVGGSADFSWQAVSFDACPLRIRLLVPLELVPCAGLHLGQLDVTGHPTTPAQGTGSRTRSTTWADAMAAMRLELSALRWLAVALEGQVIVPLTPNSFTFDSTGSTVTVYQVPSVASAAWLGLAVHFE